MGKISDLAKTVKDKAVEKYEAASNYYDQHGDVIESAQAFTMEIIASVYTIYNDIETSERKVGILDYVSAGSELVFSYKSHLRPYFNKSRFSGAEWAIETDAIIVSLIVSCLEFAYSDRIKNKKFLLPIDYDSKMNCRTLIIDDCEIVWSKIENRKMLFYKHDCFDKLKELVKKHFWEVNNHPRIRFEYSASSGEYTFIRDDFKDKFHPSQKADELCEEIQKYKEHGLSTSILIYGSPGTGKSNIVRAVGEQLGYRTLRIVDVNTLQKRSTELILELIQPDCIVLEDIDRINRVQIEKIFTDLENFNKKDIVVLATANRIGRLDAATIRPERFDRLIELEKLDEGLIRAIVENDEKLFNLCKNWPIVYIKELMKRVKIWGRDEALTKIEDIEDRLFSTDPDDYKLLINQSEIQQRINAEFDEEDEDDEDCDCPDCEERRALEDDDL